MNREQVIKLLKLLVIASVLMFIFDIIFQLDFIINPMANWIKTVDKHWIWISIWLVMFLQVAVIPIPALVILEASLATGIIEKTLETFTTANFWIFIAVTISAYVTGAIVTYFIGRKFGKKAIKWCAGSEEDYEKWVETLNKKGKWFYAGTIILPMFPDDFLCLVAGSVSLNFGFFCWVNAIGRFVGLITMMFVLCSANSISMGSSSFPWLSIIWGVAAIVLFIIYKILKKKSNLGGVVYDKK